ncbi:ABC transporter ATP-binding protein [Rothia sp. AR01]|uniref:ABC transporter ATP-binding protein n=1 Tax=Rothia santali TaxID=2949643 RepID=A0A9X2KJ77_9MICC|nr:ABC transporter ATP-binding protein [Rothia santali]MCP3426579.1 ABC transporter ATP-binding protein [Rothia santali]
MEVVIVKQPRGEPLRRRVLRRQRRRTLGSALCLMGHQSCEALVPVAIGVAIDVAVASGEPPLLLLCLAGLAALFAALTTCYRWFARLGQGAVIEESHALRTEIAARALTPGAARRRHGELLTIASSDADQAARSVIWVAGLCGTGAALVVSCGVLLTIDLRLGAVLIGTAVLVTVALNAISPLLSRRAHEQQRTLAGASALATDLVAGLRVVHGLGAQAAAVERYRRASRAAEEAGIRAGTANSLQRGATVLGASVVLTVSVGFAGYLALEGAISVGAFIAAVGVAQFISEPLTGVGTYLQVGAASKASAGRVRAVLDDDAPGASPASGMPSAPGGSPAPGAPDAAPLARDAAPELAIRVREGEFLGVVADHGQADRIVAALRTPRRTRRTSSRTAPTCSPARSPRTSRWAAARATRCRPSTPPVPATSWTPSPRDWTSTCGTAGSASPAGSGSGSRWPGRCTPTPRRWCSWTRRRRSTRSPSGRSPRASGGCVTTTPRSPARPS